MLVDEFIDGGRETVARQPPLRNRASRRRPFYGWGVWQRFLEQTCARCGESFTAPRRQKFCGRVCAARAQSEKNRIKRIKRICKVCGSTFMERPKAKRTTCSAACTNAARALAKVGTDNPNADSDTEARDRWVAAKKRRCEKCGAPATHQHHVVYQQHVRLRGGDIYDPRNSFSLCFSCHNYHHNGLDKRLAVSDLNPENIEFAVELLGAAAVDYFPRYYDNDAPHLLHYEVERQPLCPTEEAWWPGANLDPRP
jgi:ribosomal protein S27AE